MAPFGDSISRRSFLTGVAGAAAFGLPKSVAGGRVVPTLALPPFLCRPTTDSIHINAGNGEVDALTRLEIRPEGVPEWAAPGDDRAFGAGQFMQWTLEGLQQATRYEYRLLVAESGEEYSLAANGRFTTQRVGEEGFRAALMTDAHTGSFGEGTYPLDTLDDVVRNVAADRPEFVLALGDNVAWYTSREVAQREPAGAAGAYHMYRRHLAPLSPSCPHFSLVGNWEGESGKFPADSRELMARVRHLFSPNPDHLTYAQGGSANQDYYAFDWGPVLFVVLNVQSYSTPSGELATILDDVTKMEDWSLGDEQRAWAEGVLAGSDHPFKFVCIHHPVAGNAGNPHDTLYGRGGPRAAQVGEQALLHEMMLDHGVQIFFFGHDHVFLDEVVDGIHYSIPGSCGAPWKFDTSVTGYRDYWGDSGHGRLDVRPDRATVEFVDQQGRVIHRYSVEPNR